MSVLSSYWFYWIYRYIFRLPLFKMRGWWIALFRQNVDQPGLKSTVFFLLFKG